MAQVKVKKAEAFNQQTKRLKKGYRALGKGVYVKVVEPNNKKGRRRNRV